MPAQGDQNGAGIRATTRVAPTGNASGDSKIAHARYASDVGAGLVPAQGDQNGCRYTGNHKGCPLRGGYLSIRMDTAQIDKEI